MENMRDTLNETLPTVIKTTELLKHMKKYTVHELNKMSDYPSNKLQAAGVTFLKKCNVKFQSESYLCGSSKFFYTNKILCIWGDDECDSTEWILGNSGLYLYSWQTVLFY